MRIWIALAFSFQAEHRYERLMRDLLIFDAHVDTPRRTSRVTGSHNADLRLPLCVGIRHRSMDVPSLLIN